MPTPPPLPRSASAACAGVAVVMATVLFAMGRRAWCACGGWSPVSFDTWSAHNSQHLLDAYSFTHFQHGLVFFLALSVLGRDRWPGQRLVVAAVVEGAWEILENTPMVIEHYRATTISLEYFGDSVANSLSDLGCCLAGYLVAARLRWWGTVAVFVAIELTLVLTLRDSLLLNVLMLLWPVEAVRTWQGGGR